MHRTWPPPSQDFQYDSSRQNYQENQCAKNYVIIAINLLPAEQESELLSLKASFISMVALQVNGVVYK